MGKKDKRVDAYIAASADFAKPILKHLRGLVHAACPDVEETMRWSFPHFDYNGMMCSMAAFKHHCAFGFTKASLMKAASKFGQDGETAMGHLGRLERVADMPSDKTLLASVKEAARLNKDGVRIPAKARNMQAKKAVVVPEYFLKALGENKKALSAFEASSYSHKKEYVEWITEAKTEETRERRIVFAREWLAEGKGRNWKYARK